MKVLLFFDVGGSMDFHIRECEELFSAARSEFKHLDYYYFHNCLYESVWRKNERRSDERVPTWELMNTYPADYKVIFVGDAAMSPYEITDAGRLGRALERGGGAGLAAARARYLQARRLAQPHARALLGAYAVGEAHPADHREAACSR